MKHVERIAKRCGSLRQDESGVALILALVFVVLLTVLVVQFAYEIQVDASIASNHSGELETYLAAKSGVAVGIAILAEDLMPDPEQNIDYGAYDSELDPVNWYWPQPFMPLNEAMMRTSISDEYGKINLNALLDTRQEPPVEREWLVRALLDFFLLRLPEEQDKAEVIVQSILDWIDYGEDDEAREYGAETDFYQAAKVPYKARNGPMDSIEELLLIQGMTPEIYYGDPELEQLPLTEYLTVHGDWQGRVNVNTAQVDVLASVLGAMTGAGPDLALAEDIALEVHTEQPMNHPSNLDGYLGITPEEQERLRDSERREEEEGPEFDEEGRPINPVPRTAEDYFTVSSNVFRIYGDGMLDDQMARVEAYIWRTPLDLTTFSQETPPPIEPFRVLDWKVIR